MEVGPHRGLDELVECVDRRFSRLTVAVPFGRCLSWGTAFTVCRCQPLKPVTLTAHRHAGGACTTICWLPVLVWGVTALPDAAELVTAGVEPGLAPALTTKTAKVGVLAGTGVHWKAQPMFHWPPAMLKVPLVQFPDCWVAGINTVAGPVAWVVEAAVVVVEPPAPEAGVEPPADVVVVVDADE